MKVTSKHIVLFVFLFSFLSCFNSGKTTDSANDDSFAREKYFRLEDRGWKSNIIHQKAGDILFSATEVPVAYYILKNEGNNDLLKVDSIEQANKYERVLEFTFLHNEEKDLLSNQFTAMDYEDGVKYMSFSIKDDFQLVTSNFDTINCSGVIFERAFKVTPYNKIMLFFSGINPDEDIQLLYDDKLFQKGTLKFKFEEKTTKLLL